MPVPLCVRKKKKKGGGGGVSDHGKDLAVGSSRLSGVSVSAQVRDGAGQ